MSRNPHRNNVSSKTIKADTRGMFDFVEGKHDYDVQGQ